MRRQTAAAAANPVVATEAEPVMMDEAEAEAGARVEVSALRLRRW